MKTNRFAKPAALLGLLSALMFAAAPAANAQVLYQQDFTNNYNWNVALGVTAAPGTSTAGWAGYMGANATLQSGNTGWDTAAGILLSLSDVVFTRNLATANQVFVARGTFSAIDFASTEITWKQGSVNGAGSAAGEGSSTATGIEFRVMVQSGGSWYATDATFTNATALASGTAFINATIDTNPSLFKTFVFTTDASAWRTVTLIPGTELSLGVAPGSNISSSITGIGFYVNQPLINTRGYLDTLAVTVIPEPGSLALAAIGGLAIVGLRRTGRTRQ